MMAPECENWGHGKLVNFDARSRNSAKIMSVSMVLFISDVEWCWLVFVATFFLPFVVFSLLQEAFHMFHVGHFSGTCGLGQIDFRLKIETVWDLESPKRFF